jgi:tripartite-type tricarboxylate transporter receptor subunit TctC
LASIAVTSTTRLKSAPDIPTIAEQGYPEYDFTTFYGLAAPKGTPPAIVSKLNQEVNKALQLPEVRSKIDPTGAEITGGTQKQFADFLENNLSKFKKIVSLTNASAK